jgi:voltage-gated potassium channel
MIIGYAIIAVPTGIVTSEMVRANTTKVVCPACGADLKPEARYCSNCGIANEQKKS